MGPQPLTSLKSKISIKYNDYLKEIDKMGFFLSLRTKSIYLSSKISSLDSTIKIAHQGKYLAYMIPTPIAGLPLVLGTRVEAWRERSVWT